MIESGKGSKQRGRKTINKYTEKCWVDAVIRQANRRQWTVDEAEVVSPHNWCDWDWLFICFAGLLWLKAKPIPEKSLDSACLVSSLGARRTFRRLPLPVSAWVLTAFWLINITFRFGFVLLVDRPYLPPSTLPSYTHKYCQLRMCAPFRLRGSFVEASFEFFLYCCFFLLFEGLRKQFVCV